MELLKESSVGISCFMSSFKGFSGIIKHRYNDFHVYEIDNDLEKVHLTLLSRPADILERVPDEEQFKKVKELCPDLDLEKLKELLASKSTERLDTPPITTKPSRTEFHKVIRELSDGKLDTQTIGDNIISITPLSSTKPSKRRADWSQGDYTHFTLYKENKDTMDALSILSGLLKINSKTFSFAGTKDKRAITTQRVSAYRVDPDKLLSLNSRLRGLKVGNAIIKKEKLNLGDSKGNHFIIVLRQVKGDKTEILDSIHSLSQTGFINYFGMQRFGTRQVSTHQIGMSILRGDWEKCVDLIIGSSSDKDSREEIIAARREWEKSRDPLSTVKIFPRFCTGERAVLDSLVKQAKGGRLDYLEAINQIPRNLKSMYLHAYQSRVWNEMTSIRHIKYGCQVKKGDLVRIPCNDGEEEFRGLGNVKVIENDKDLENFTYLDIVLPLPGHAVVYPKNEIGKAYKEFMALDGFDPEDMTRKQPDFSLPGFYRHCYKKPLDVCGKVVMYSDKGEPVDFIQTDLDRIEGKSVPDQFEGENNLMAVVVEFTLGSSEYATMVLRELTKMETSAGFQTQLSQKSNDHSKKRPASEIEN